MADITSIYESFTLPSKGKVYPTLINPEITLRSMTTLEEMKRLSPTESPYKIMSDIIEDCMKTKPQMRVYDMCLGDYQYLLHKLRIVTYGPEYKLVVECPNCFQITEATADLESLAVREWDESMIEESIVTLPKSGHEVTLKLQSARDIDIITYKNKEFKKKLKTSVDYTILFTILSVIKKVDGRQLNEVELEEFAKSLPMKDVNFLIAKADEQSGRIGLDTDITAKCSGCGHEIHTTFRLTSEFFGPDAD